MFKQYIPDYDPLKPRSFIRLATIHLQPKQFSYLRKKNR